MKYFIIIAAFFAMTSQISALDSMSLLKMSDKNLYKKALRLSELKNIKSKECIYVFSSLSLDKEYFYSIIEESYHLSKKFIFSTIFVFQGPFFTEKSQEIFEYINKRSGSDPALSKYVRQIKFEVSPRIFKELNIKKVPALGYAYSSNGDSYPHYEDMEFLVRGRVSLEKFINMILKHKEK